MSESAKKILKNLIAFLLFLLCLALVIVGQRQIGAFGLLIMLLGLSGLIVMLWLYNRKFK